VEVVVSIVLLSIFSIATAAVVAQGTAASADNRARIAASGLAQRELEFVADIIAASPEGVDSLLSPATAVNPNVTGDLDSGDPVFAYRVDGDKFRVERQTKHQMIGAGSPCEVGGPATTKQFATLVQVTVAWEGMSAGTKPHVESALFPPHRGASAAGLADQAILGVDVTGVTGADAGRPDMKVRVTGPGTAFETTTDATGCAIVVVKPPATGADYEVTLLGHTGPTLYVDSNRQPQPSQTVYSLKPGDSRPVPFELYDPAASLTVTVDTTLDPSVTSVAVLPSSAGFGPEMPLPLTDGKAEFDILCPGNYSVWAGTSSGTPDAPGPVSVVFGPLPVTLGPTEHVEVSLP
jgi:hypothetical protein